MKNSELPADCERICHCVWCSEIIGHQAKGELPRVSKIAHMKEKHPIRRQIAYLLAPLLKGGLLYCPVSWSHVGHE